MRYILLLVFLSFFLQPVYSQYSASNQHVEPVAKALYDSGMYFMQKSNDPEGLKYITAAEYNYETTGDKMGRARCYQAMGQIAVNHGNATAGTRYFLAALKLAEALKDKSSMANCYNRIGDINKSQRNYADALKYDNLAIALFKATNDKNGLGSCYNSIGDVYENEGNLDEALKNYNYAVKVLQEAGAMKSLTWPYYNIGEVYMLKGHNDLALDYYRRALKIQDSIGDQNGVAWTYNNMAIVYKKQKNYDTAIAYSLRSLAITTEQNELSGMSNANKNLSELYEITGNPTKALFYYKAYRNEQDVLYNRDNTRNLTTQQMQYDFDQKEAETKEQQSKKDLISREIAVLLTMIAFIVIGAYFTQRRASKLKSAMLLQKEESIVQKEMLMREIHHRVKNNLQVIGTLLELQLANITDIHAKDAIAESSLRLKAISLIHLQLYQDAYNATIQCEQFTSDLHAQVSTIFVNTGQTITLRNEVPPIVLDIDTAVPLGLILNELMTNSYKYAFNGDSGSIDLRIEKNEDSYTLKYTDSGPGLPGSGDIKSLKGLGMLIIQSLSKQIGGAFTYSSETKTFVITFRDAVTMKKNA